MSNFTWLHGKRANHFQTVDALSGGSVALPKHTTILGIYIKHTQNLLLPSSVRWSLLCSDHVVLLDKVPGEKMAIQYQKKSKEEKVSCSSSTGSREDCLASVSLGNKRTSSPYLGCAKTAGHDR